jgi:hypothetical protein
MTVRYDEGGAEEITRPGMGGDEDVEDTPPPLAVRVARLEGKVDLLAKDVRAVLSQTTSTTKKLQVARMVGAGVAGIAVTLAPTHAGSVGKALEAILSLFG